MAVVYQTVFETSYFSNGILFWDAIFLAIGIFATATAVALARKRLRGPALFLGFISLVWILTTIWMCVTTVKEGLGYMASLRNGSCGTEEGVVEVLYRQPEGGHSAGDRIRINKSEFEINYFETTFAYSQTLAHGGALNTGVQARVHFLGNRILKVEIAEPRRE
jgi:hypothetical protein